MPRSTATILTVTGIARASHPHFPKRFCRPSWTTRTAHPRGPAIHCRFHYGAKRSFPEQAPRKISTTVSPGSDRLRSAARLPSDSPAIPAQFPCNSHAIPTPFPCRKRAFRHAPKQTMVPCLASERAVTDGYAWGTTVEQRAYSRRPSGQASRRGGLPFSLGGTRRS